MTVLRVEHAEGAEDDDATGAEVPIVQRAEVDQRIGDPELAVDQAAEAATNRSSSVWMRQNGSPNQSHSCPLLRRISQRDHRHAQEAEAEGVERLAPTRAARARSALRYSGSMTTARHSRERQEPDGDVDVEDPAPAVVVGDVAAERRADDRRQQAPRCRRPSSPALASPSETRRAARPGSTAAARRRPGPAARGTAISAMRLLAMPHKADASVKTAIESRK